MKASVLFFYKFSLDWSSDKTIDQISKLPDDDQSTPFVICTDIFHIKQKNQNANCPLQREPD